MPKVYLICGKICSGKSYYSKELSERINGVILSPDEATYDLIENEQGEFYNIFCSRVINYLNKKAVEIVKAGANVIYERGLWSKDERDKAREYFKNSGIETELHYVYVDDDTWKKQIEERNKRVLAGNGGSDFYLNEGLMKKLLSMFEEPSKTEVDVWYDNQYFNKIDLDGIKTPDDILKFMDNIEYGYMDIYSVKHINSLKGFRLNYKTASIEDTLNNGIGTCIEQVSLMNYLLNRIGKQTKMFCTRIYEEGEINPEQDEHMHCFILYYDEDGVHQIEHPNGDRKGIYHFKDEETAIEEINKIYVEMSGGIPRPVTEFNEVPVGLSFGEFNDYVNSLDKKSRKMVKK